MNYMPGQEVDLLILRETDLGFVARINGADEGLLYRNEIFRELRPGDEVPGYINRVLKDGKIDLLLEPFGNLGSDDIGTKIMAELKAHKGVLKVNASSPAETIYEMFGVSKKKFKIALGGLYKRQLIRITDEGIELT